jgi:metal-sulfur cluster biosynthetic enzyme
MPKPEEIQNALKEIYDPEIPINIVDLGLVYKAAETAPGKVRVEFTLTTPGCPIGDEIKQRIREAVGRLQGVVEVDPELVWDPPWTKEMLTADGRLQASMLGIT